MTATTPSISAFFPCYNDAPTIARVVRDADATLSRLTADYEILVVNDGSRDNSADVLCRLQMEVSRLRVLTHGVNRGYGCALRSGLAAASKDVVFYTDGDGQYDVKEVAILLAILSDDVDFVNGIKMRRSDPPYRVHIGNLHRFLNRWVFWLPISDVDCDFRLIRRWVIDRAPLTSHSGAICGELVKRAERAGASFREVGVHHYPRRHGASQFFTPSRIMQTYVELAGLWVRLMVLEPWTRRRRGGLDVSPPRHDERGISSRANRGNHERIG